MYCRIIPLEMDGGDHVMLITLPTAVTVAFCTEVGAKFIKLVLNTIWNSDYSYI